MAIGAGAVVAGATFALRRRGGDRALPATDLAAIRHIGEVYLRSHPDLRAGTLRQQLPAGIDLSGDAAIGLRRLRDQVRRDYVDGEVELLDGWRLSRTALRAASLVALGG
jgi:hypothetical protein